MTPTHTNQNNTNSEKRTQAVIFDLDGVITDTADAHFGAWKQMFDPYLEDLASREGKAFEPFDRKDYRRYVDGKPRYDGVKSFLGSRDIKLDYGAPDDPPDRETVCGLGNRKNEIFQKVIDSGGVKVYPEAVRLVNRLKSEGIRTAVVSSSKNCDKVLAAANLTDLFDARVDGKVSESLGLEGKPAPDIFLKAAEALKVEPERAVVVEDAISGVEAGRRGGFARVIGVNRSGADLDLKKHGADQVVNDLSDIAFDTAPVSSETDELPSALDNIDEIAGWLAGGKAALFLDYDGTLTPIVDRPEEAVLSDEMRKTLTELAERYIVAIVSGRGLADVRERVGIETIYYAGSHGFEIVGPDQSRIRNEKGTDALPELDDAETALQKRLADIDGALVERKRFSIAVHYRQVASTEADAVEGIVDDLLRQYPKLRKGSGKKIFELQPDVEWDKGHAVGWLMDELELSADSARPIYIGDDVTDEDAFRALKGKGAGIIVHGGLNRPTFADYGLFDPEAVRKFLEHLTA